MTTLLYALLTAAVTVTNPQLSPENGGVRSFGCDIKFSPGSKVEDIRFYARRGTKDLYLGSNELRKKAAALVAAGGGRFEGSFPSGMLPPGAYQLVVKTTYRAEPEKSFLYSGNGRTLAENTLARGRNVELKCRITSPFHFALRNQQKPTVSSDTWRNYECLVNPDGSFYCAKVVQSKWRRFSPQLPRGTVSVGKSLREIVFRAQDRTLSLSVDKFPVVRWTDEEDLYPNGTLFFRTLDAAPGSYVTDIEITDLDTGKVLLKEDFSSGKPGPGWNFTGRWEVVKGYPAGREDVLGAFSAAPKQGGDSLAESMIVRRDEDLRLFVNGKQYLPLIFCNIAGNFPYSENIYDTVRGVGNAGVRIFAPAVAGFASAVNARTLDEVTNDILFQIHVACPEALLLPRTGLAIPKELPESEKIKFRDGLAEDAKETSADAAKSINNLSLASDLYVEKFMQVLLRNLVGDLRRSKFGGMTMGFLLTGGGYEGSWGNGGQAPKYLVDVCDAQLRQYRKFLQAKYKTVEALRRAWEDPSASFEKVHVPNLIERTCSDVAGFRSPSVPRSRKVQDFIEMYANENDLMRRKVHAAARAEAPKSFLAAFLGGVLNTSWSHIQFHPHTTANRMPEISCNVSIETYSDRNAGGVSICTNYAHESMRLHGKMHLQELDFATPSMPASWAPKSWKQVTEVLRREFAVNVLMRQDAMWIFDMGYTGPWYNHPEVLQELAEEVKVGQK
ncbi:MAG: hypothetical protein PHS41_08845, partial [Victivallaceae bacterium]|nr:hypothetical protein [Victivallaceae bacterium]